MKATLIVIILFSDLLVSNLRAGSYSEALTYLKTRQLDKALAAIDASIQSSESAAAYELKGRILHAMGRTEAAMDSFEYVTRLEPRRGSVHFYKGEVFFKAKRWSEAFHTYRHALEIEPERKDSILKMIYCLVIMENYPMAHQWLTTLDPANDLKPDYYFARAAMAYATENPEEYVSVLRQARTIYSTQVFNRYEPD
ncbi:MAG: tetratricopeptide repeat protein, partial [Verrucomicrobiota bacterium]